MNEHLRIDVDPSEISPLVRKMMRRRWTVAEVDALAESEPRLEDEHFELIDGEVVPLPAKGNHHELLKIALIDFWVKRAPQGVRLAPETTFRITADTFLEPDFVFYRTSDGLVSLRPQTAQLVVEIADSSLGFDLGRKARLYASLGIRELWVINAVKLVCHIHRGPSTEGFAEKRAAAPNEILTPNFAPELAVVLSELELV